MDKVEIVCIRERGIWRGGHFHPAGKQVYAADHFSPQSLALIKAERLLVVREFREAPERTETAQESNAGSGDVGEDGKVKNSSTADSGVSESSEEKDSTRSRRKRV